MERITKTRAIAALLVLALILGLYTMQMFAKQRENVDAAPISGNTNTTLTRVVAARGAILDRNGNVLVTNRASFNLVFDNFVFLSGDDPNGSLQTLISACEDLGLSYNEHFPVTDTKPYEYTLEDYGSAWQGYFRAFLENRSLDSDISASRLVRELRSAYHLPDDWSDEEVRKIIGLRYEIELRSGVTNLPAYVFVDDISADDLSVLLETNTPGMSVEYTTVREYNTKYAAHILGFVSAIEPDEADYYDEQGYDMDAKVGQSGLELAFEKYLHGSNGWKRTVTDSSGNVISETWEVEPVAGNNVETSIDLSLQITAERALENHILNIRENGVNDKGDGKDAEGGAVVVENVKTGEILACASYPTYDPATYHENYSKLLAEPFDPLYDRALLAAYAPGSIFKVCMTIAGIDAGVITKHTPVTDEGVFTKYAEDGFAPQCLIYTNKGITHGTIDVEQALMVSCNYYFYWLGDQLNIATIDATAKALGLGEKSGIEMPEAQGRRANPETKKEIYGDDYGEWYTADKITASIGQSENRFTPIQMCSYAATLANRGTRYRCTFLSRVVSADYQTLVAESEPEILNQLEISDEAYEAYTTGMNMCAQEPEGSLYETFGDYPVKICAKTGTAEHGGGGSGNCSLILFAPADNPEIAISIFVEKGAYSGQLGPIARAILDVYFNQTTSDENLPLENGLN